jgi:hypothetical protein
LRILIDVWYSNSHHSIYPNGQSSKPTLSTLSDQQISSMCFFDSEPFLRSLTNPNYLLFPNIEGMSNFVPGLVLSSSPMFSYTLNGPDTSWHIGSCSNHTVPFCQGSNTYASVTNPNGATIAYGPVNVNKGGLQYP